ncbi:hypothetical protein [Endozoicomonas sp. SCSIO W0465]|uniref:hypothetical protein n=1 Tax=Endozoicomonas sp. SCSIO W0465 TaxID=2918516 RepID=UPI002074F6D2|nr:hypothetical protein [Endozoicomonas sp. SCSIO W0465]USE37123.1 hypothetical protein MJO57_02510 [Endozoicomonas sp. SCSIO W0465]
MNTTHLLKAIEQQPPSANSAGFDRFITDMSQFLRGKTGQTPQTTEETGNSQPQENPEPAEKRPDNRFNSDIIARQNRPRNLQLLTDILQREQALLLANIQQPDVHPVRELKSNTAPTHQSRGAVTVQPEPGKSIDHPAPIFGKTNTP